MNDAIIIVLVVGAVIGAVVRFVVLPKLKNKKQNTSLEGDFPNLPVKGVPKKWNFTYKTPNGVSVGSTVEIKEEFQTKVFQAIEYGITNQLNATKAKFPGWTQKRNLSDYVVGFIEPQATNMDGSPALMVQEKYQTAGTVIGIYGDTYPEQTIILPHQAAQKWSYLTYLLYSSWNESEHFAEFPNDLELALSFATSGDVHQHHNLPAEVKPLLIEEQSAARSFFAPARPKCYFNPKINL